MRTTIDILRDFCRARGRPLAYENLQPLLTRIAETDYKSDYSFYAGNQIIASLAERVPVDLTTFELHPDDFVFAQHIEKLKKLLRGDGLSAAAVTRVSHTTERDDFIAENPGKGRWSLLQTINFILQLTIVPKKQAAVVASVRNEGLSILEWIAHHRAHGFDDIFIYTNNNTDGSTELLRCLAEQQIIYLIENEVGSLTSPQKKAYEHSLHLLPMLRNYRWVSYLDADEFLISRCQPTLDLHSLLAEAANSPHPAPDAILLNWKWFGSENVFSKTEGFLLNRFTHSIHNRHVKTLARTDAIISMWPLHVPMLMADSIACNSRLERIDNATPEIQPSYGIGQINHYWNKSFEEFVLKQDRGRGAVGSLGEQRSFEAFFSWGNNDRRGNYDPPLERVVRRLCDEYDKLLGLDGVAVALRDVQARSEAELRRLSGKLDLPRLYANRGALKPSLTA